MGWGSRYPVGLGPGVNPWECVLRSARWHRPRFPLRRGQITEPLAQKHMRQIRLSLHVAHRRIKAGARYSGQSAPIQEDKKMGEGPVQFAKAMRMIQHGTAGPEWVGVHTVQIAKLGHRPKRMPNTLILTFGKMWPPSDPWKVRSSLAG